MNEKAYAKKLLREIRLRIRSLEVDGECPFEEFPSVKLKVCYLAEKDHKESARNFAHTIHKKNTVCVCEDFFDLPEENQRGILWHEIGHLFREMYEPDEESDHHEWLTDDEEVNADRVVQNVFGVRIYYDENKIQMVDDSRAVSGSP